jgi:hypothetical protein
MEEKMSNDPQSPEAELARLADGSLPETRAAELRAQVAQSPQLRQALAEQERALALVRMADPPAPDSLRRWVDEQTRAAAPARKRPRLRIGFALPAIAALAVVIAALVVVASGGSSAPTLQQTTHLALAAAVAPAPSVSPGNPAILTDTAAGIPFPNWGPAGWKPSGARVDKVAGRTIMTVFYTDPNGSKVGYAIVGGAPVKVSGGTTQNVGGVEYTFLTIGSAHLVTWVQSGHTCVVAGRDVSHQTLKNLVTA